jgi:alginate O-acetyltransferase complex protein AlgI
MPLIFTSYWFVYFAALYFLIYWLAGWAGSRAPAVRLWFMLGSCFVFHGHFAGAAGVAPIIALGLITYGAGLTRHKVFLYGAIAICVAALIFYKYTHFLALSVVGALSASWGEAIHQAAKSALPAAPPLAVSFFTFEFVHYLYDVSHGKPSIRKLSDFAAFGFFFPSLVAGPIKRYEQFLPSMHHGFRQVSLLDVQEGILRIAIGYFKKVVIADNLTAFIQYQDDHIAQLGMGERWFLVAAIALRILMDFSGYSDIAIGLARLMGIRLPENFNWPYLSLNIREFWQRWHISLSSWIRDYIYIPLGGNRHGPFRRVANGLIAFGLCGLWHGPDWNFIVWGLYHGLGLAISSSYRVALGSVGRGLGNILDSLPALAWALTMLFVGIGWIFFFYPMGEACEFLRLLVMPV